MPSEQVDPVPDASIDLDNEFELTGADLDVHHRLVREMMCSLPRSMSCRMCPGERDCPYIVDRPYGRLVVHRRPPHLPVVLHRDYALTGRDDPVQSGKQWGQIFLALLGWVLLLVLVLWGWILHFPGWSQLELAGIFLGLTFLEAVIGVPLVRKTWRDRGGERVVDA